MLRERWQRAANYVLYYGRGLTGLLRRFDLAVVEPAAYSAQEIAAVQAAGTLVLAYQSVLEVHPGLPLYHLAGRQDFLMWGGERVYYPEFGTWLLDPRAEGWQDALLAEVGEKVYGLGYDGLFLDTVGRIEDPRLRGAYGEGLVIAAARLIMRIRDSLPGALLVQNHGLTHLWPLTAPRLDGLCWENLPAESLMGRGAGAPILEALAAGTRRAGARLLLLSEGLEPGPPAGASWEEIADLAARRGLLFYRAPGGYTVGINMHGKGATGRD